MNEGAGVCVRFERDVDGLIVVDPIERHRYRLETPETVDPAPVETDDFLFPVDRAIGVTTSSLRLSSFVATYIRNADGVMLVDLATEEEHTLPAGSYSIELCAPVKTYIRVEGPFTVDAKFNEISFDFKESHNLRIGARSHHEQPAATITTTDDPADIFAAISTFGSALKTTSPERSFPTLRGHPPMVERGDRLNIPAGLEAPVTSLHLEAPPTLDHAYPLAPLAYYLGCDLRPGAEATLVGPDFEYRLNNGTSFERTIERLLKRVFFLDCVTRTEGLYKVQLSERLAIEDDVDMDFAAVYDAPVAERIHEYLQVPYSVIEPHLPDWLITSHVTPTAQSIETLPFLVDDLAVVKIANPTTVEPRALETGEVHGLVRGATAAQEPYVKVEPSQDSIAETWVGDGMPISAGKAVSKAYQNRVGREPARDSIDISVVCNDPQMDQERNIIEDVYGSRDELPFDVSIERSLDRAQLEALLREDFDFLHYIGHIDDGGFRCSDGLLDVETIDSVGVNSFFLNACTSYRQGLHLLESGAIGGIVTLSDVVNTSAVRLGGQIAQLLNQGFPLTAALQVASEQNVIGIEYTVVGDGGLTIAQSESNTAQLAEIEREAGSYMVTVRSFTGGDMGEINFPLISANNQYFLNSGTIGPFEVEKDQLVEWLQMERFPVTLDGSLNWSTDLFVDTL